MLAFLLFLSGTFLVEFVLDLFHILFACSVNFQVCDHSQRNGTLGDNLRVLNCEHTSSSCSGVSTLSNLFSVSTQTSSRRKAILLFPAFFCLCVGIASCWRYICAIFIFHCCVTTLNDGSSDCET